LTNRPARSPQLPAPTLWEYRFRLPSPHAYELAARFRRSGIPVVLGGIHVTLNPEEAAEHADAIVVGEAEAAWSQVVRDARAGRLAMRYDAPGPVPLQSSPRPRRDLMPRSCHTPSVMRATKGCPFDCEFCSLAGLGHRRLRRRSVQHVVDEIRALPAGPILFVDDNLYADRSYVRQVARGALCGQIVLYSPVYGSTRTSVSGGGALRSTSPSGPRLGDSPEKDQRRTG